MKKLLIYTFVIFATMLGACKKSYTCTCKLSDGSEDKITMNYSPSEAKKNCDAAKTSKNYSNCSLD